MHWTEWPTRDHHSSSGYLYVLEFSSGAVKVGHTTDPAARAKTLHLDCAKYGLHITRWWLSPRHTNHADNERALLHAARGLGDQLATEYFHCDFHAAVEAASTLPMSQDPVVPRALTRGAQRTAQKRAEAQKMRAEGFSIRQIANALDLSVGSVHAFCTN